MNKSDFGNQSNFIHGTAVFLARTPSQIVVAADSRQVNENEEIISDDVCKIRRFGSGYLVVNGYTGGDAEYDFFSLLAATANDKFSLVKNADRLAAAIIAPLAAAVNRVKDENPSSFHRNLVEKPALGFCAFGIENKRLMFFQRQFPVALDPDGTALIAPAGRDFPDADNPGGAGLYLVGPGDEFNQKFFVKYPALRGGMNAGLISVARDYIQTQIDDGDIKDVGGPIDIMRVTAEGFRWVQKKDGGETA